MLRKDLEIYDDRMLLPKHIIAKAFGVSVDSVTKWDVNPAARKGREALYYLSEVVNYRQGGDGTRLDPGQEKAKLDQIRREQAELNLRKQRGEIVEVDEVCNELEKELIACRQKLLALPNKMARPIILAETPQEVQEMLSKEVHKCLEGLNYGGRIKFDQPSASADSEDAKAPAPVEPS